MQGEQTTLLKVRSNFMKFFLTDGAPNNNVPKSETVRLRIRALAIEFKQKNPVL